MNAIELLAHKGARQLFETLRAYPKRQFTINELSKTARLPFTTTWKLVQKFELAQIAEVATIGRSRAVRYRETPYSRLVSDILKMGSSPQALALPELKHLLRARKGVVEAYLFGSVALKKEKLESDIDVALLVGKRMDLPSLISAVYDKYGVKVVPLAFESKDELEDFLRDKKKVRLV
ncbi:nucleotidyltransferase domain-containing protein [Candidatus Micrarchaeota archaeon]|nr:nucleotidyltransferase domain-containing protein [Candidatus Micrarchaeota archaeon]